MIMCTYKRICITNRNLVVGDYLEQIRKVVDQGVDLLILREKDLTESEYLDLSRDVIEICRGSKTRCMLHTFAGVAEQLDYPYLHLPLAAFLMLTETQRSYYKIIGVSTHSVEEALLAQEKGASYITASHIFPTECKAGLPPRGLDYLRRTAQMVDIDVYALGGIHPDNIHLCIEAGADGICMMSEYMK